MEPEKKEFTAGTAPSKNTFESLMEAVKNPAFILGIFDLLLLTCSGIFLLFVFRSGPNEAFFSPDVPWVKLLFLALSFTTPFVVINLIPLYFALPEYRLKPNAKLEDASPGFFMLATFSIFWTSFLIYIISGYAYVYNEFGRNSLRNFVLGEVFLIISILSYGLFKPQLWKKLTDSKDLLMYLLIITILFIFGGIVFYKFPIEQTIISLCQYES